MTTSANSRTVQIKCFSLMTTILHLCVPSTGTDYYFTSRCPEYWYVTLVRYVFSQNFDFLLAPIEYTLAVPPMPNTLPSMVRNMSETASVLPKSANLIRLSQWLGPPSFACNNSMPSVTSKKREMG